MQYAGVTVFLAFFGLSLLDALSHGPWWRAVFWLGIGLVFLVMSSVRRGRPGRA